MNLDRNAVALEQIRRLFDGGRLGGLTDAELLERFKDHDGDQAERAFAELVERHGPMVLRVARSILREPHDANDAFQATFLVLVRKANALSFVDSLGPWLHGVACKVALSLRAATIRRRVKEASVTQGTNPGRDEDDLGSTLHAEIDRLPARYRTAVVLCLLQGLTQEQAAHQLGWPPGTVRSRLARGRERLQARLTRQGFAPTVITLTRLLSPELYSASLFESATRIAMKGQVASASAQVLILSSTVSRSLSIMSRVKWLAMLCLAAGLGAVGCFAFFQLRPAHPPEISKVETPKPPMVARWQYQLERLILETEIADKSNEQASKGWEVVEVVPVIHGIGGSIHTQYTILFRRPVDK